MISVKRSTSRVSATTTGGHHHHQNKTMSKCEKCFNFMKNVVTFLFSHIGLCALLLGYTLIGAFTFQALESKNEQEQRSKMRQTRNMMIMELFQETKKFQFLKDDLWKKKAEEKLKEFELKFLDAVKHKGYDGSEELATSTKMANGMAVTSSQWSFSGALLYSIIVITTIGYGNVAPRTDWGKIVTIIYAVIGIPLMLFCLSNIGHTLANSFKFIYWKCCCYLCVKPPKLKRIERQRRRRLRRKYRQQQQMATLMLIQQQQQQQLQANYHLSPKSSMSDYQQPQRLTRSLSNQSTFNNNAPNHSSITPIRQNFQTNFGDLPSNGDHQNTLQLPPSRTIIRKKAAPPLLSRSMSARYHGERKKKPDIPMKKTSMIVPNLKLKNRNEQPSKPTTKPALPVICNKYATISNSDECLPDQQQSNNEEPQRLSYLRSSSISEENPSSNKMNNQVRFHQQEQEECSNENEEAELQQQPQQLRTSPSLYNSTISSNRRSISTIEAPNFPLRHFSPMPSPCLTQNHEMIEMNSLSTFPTYMMNNSQQNRLNNNSLLFNFMVEEACPEAGTTASYLRQPNHPESLDINNIASNIDLTVDDDDDSDDDYSDETDEDKDIPITVCLALVIGYICGGAWFFSISEGWPFLDASYFCFITLSTIGFGDLVPGRTVLSTTPEDGQMTLAICALYLLFGMALLAMSLNLVKEKVTETVRIIGQRIGIIVTDDDEDDFM